MIVNRNTWLCPFYCMLLQWVRPNSPRWCGQISLNTMDKAKFTQVVWADFPQYNGQGQIHPGGVGRFPSIQWVRWCGDFPNSPRWCGQISLKHDVCWGKFIHLENLLLTLCECCCLFVCFLNRDSSVVRAPDSWLKDSRFKSLQGGWENFLLWG